MHVKAGRVIIVWHLRKYYEYSSLIHCNISSILANEYPNIPQINFKFKMSLIFFQIGASQNIIDRGSFFKMKLLSDLLILFNYLLFAIEYSYLIVKCICHVGVMCIWRMECVFFCDVLMRIIFIQMQWVWKCISKFIFNSYHWLKSNFTMYEVVNGGTVLSISKSMWYRSGKRELHDRDGNSKLPMSLWVKLNEMISSYFKIYRFTQNWLELSLWETLLHNLWWNLSLIFFFF